MSVIGNFGGFRGPLRTPVNVSLPGWDCRSFAGSGHERVAPPGRGDALREPPAGAVVRDERDRE